MQGEAQPVRGREVYEHRFVDRLQIVPGVGMGVEALKEQQVGQHALDPVDVGGVADDRAAARALEKALRKAATAAAREHAAGREIDEIVVAAAPVLENSA